MKKYSLLSLSVFLALISTNAVFAEIRTGNCGVDGNNATYSFNTETGVLTIRGTGEMMTCISLNDLPWWTFREQVKDVIVENGITSVSGGSFSYCTNLTNIIIPNSITTIGAYAFQYCTGLTNIIIPNSVTTIENGAFYGCI